MATFYFRPPTPDLQTLLYTTFSLVAGRSLGHESGLERDAYLASAFVPGLVAIEEQPVRIQSDANSYHPDAYLRVEVHGDGKAGAKECLIEIKYISDLRKQWAELWPRLELGRDYARGMGWTFKVLTELEIRGPDFPCVRFLRRYLKVQVPNPFREWVMESLGARSLTILELLDYGSQVFELPARKLIPAIWHLVATQQVYLAPQPQLSFQTMLFHPACVETHRWVPCASLIDALLAPWEVRP